MKNISLLSRILLSFFLTAGTYYPVCAQEEFPGIATINSTDLMETVTYLASPGLEGRAAGSEGYMKAAHYMVNRLANLKLQPIDTAGWVQEVRVEYCHITETPEVNRVKNGNDIKKYELGKDYVCRGQTGFGDITGELVFCGYGISEPALGYDDYENADVKGKIVMVFKQNPSWPVRGLEMGKLLTRYKENKAAEHGAVAIVFVSTPLAKDPQKPIGSVMDGEGTYDEHFPAIHMDIKVADELLADSSVNLKTLQQQIDTLKKPLVFPMKSSLHIKIKGEYFKNRKSVNMIALLPGSDPVLSKQYLIIGAHLDHVGKQGKDLYFPGANDNASGSAAVLDLAQAFAKAAVKPKLSVIFVLYTSEEQGLIGSQYFVDHCPVPREKIVAAINLDCVGVGDSIQIGNGKSNPKLWNMARTQDSLSSKLMVRDTWDGGGADLEAFYKAGIPGLYFVTRNSYTHLHMPSDKPETLNQDLYVKVVKLAYRVAYKISEGQYQKEKIKVKK